MKLQAIIDSYSEDHHTLPDFKISFICFAPHNTEEGKRSRKELFEILATHLTEREPLSIEISIPPKQ